MLREQNGESYASELKHYAESENLMRGGWILSGDCEFDANRTAILRENWRNSTRTVSNYFANLKIWNLTRIPKLKPNVNWKSEVWPTSENRRETLKKGDLSTFSPFCPKKQRGRRRLKVWADQNWALLISSGFVNLWDETLQLGWIIWARLFLEPRLFTRPIRIGLG